LLEERREIDDISFAQRHCIERSDGVGNMALGVLLAAGASHDDDTDCHVACLERPYCIDDIVCSPWLGQKPEQGVVSAFHADVYPAQAPASQLRPFGSCLAAHIKRIDEGEDTSRAAHPGSIDLIQPCAYARHGRDQRVRIGQEERFSQPEGCSEKCLHLLDVRSQLCRAFDPKRAVPVEVTERAAIIRAAFGRLDHQRQVLIGRQNADGTIDAAEPCNIRGQAFRSPSAQHLDPGIAKGVCDLLGKGMDPRRKGTALLGREPLPPAAVRASPFAQHATIERPTVVAAIFERADQPSRQVERVTRLFVADEDVDGHRSHAHRNRPGAW